MATVDSITKRLDTLDKDRGYFSIEDFISALEREIPGESLIEVMEREHPFKAIHPSMVQSLGLAAK